MALQEALVVLQRLVAELSGGEREREGEAAREAALLVRAMASGRESAHVRLCTAMLAGWEAGAAAGAGAGERELLHALGPASVLSVACTCLPRSTLSAAKWLCGEVLDILLSRKMAELLFSECRPGSAPPSRPPALSPRQEQLAGAVTHLPDVMANRLGRHLNPALLPHPFFTALGNSLGACLQLVLQALRDSQSCVLAFPAAVLGRAALLDRRGAMLSALLPVLEVGVAESPLWCRIVQTLVSRVPPAGLEPLLEGLVLYTSPSLLPSCPLRGLLGTLPLSSTRARFVLGHKLILVKPPSLPSSSPPPPGPHPLHTLVGYLASSDELQAVLADSMMAAVQVWGDASAIRHMASRHHVWLSQFLVLAAVCIHDNQLAKIKSGLQRSLMSGVGVHIESPLPTVRGRGMGVAELVMNILNPPGAEQPGLTFDLEETDEVKMLRLLARPVAEQEKDLRREWRAHRPPSPPPPSTPPPPPASVGRFGGVACVQGDDTASSDSDDELEPYVMDDDPEASLPHPPRYLRSLLEGLLTSDPQKHAVCLRAAERLIRSEPADLPEVCLELCKVLLHLSDQFALEGFAGQRLGALTALGVGCPAPVSQYLAAQFYTDNYTTRQRMDVLEVLAAAATELSTPSSSSSSSSSSSPSSLTRPRPPSKPWDAVIQERLRQKTRFISKGTRHPPPLPTPSRFSAVAPLFFFPLLSGFDRPSPCLDLLARDSLLLGNLLYTVGVVMHASTHSPAAPSMASALMDFVWALRYHTSSHVRQGALFSLAMLLSAAPAHSLRTDLEGGVAEALLWVKDVMQSDAEDGCRGLAQEVAAIIHSLLQETGPP